MPRRSDALKPQRPYLLIPEAARMLGIPTSTAHRHVQQTNMLCGIPAIQITATRKGVNRRDVEALAAQNAPAKGARR